MAFEKGGPEGDRVGGLHPLHVQTQILQHKDYGGTYEHRSLDSLGDFLTVNDHRGTPRT